MDVLVVAAFNSHSTDPLSPESGSDIKCTEGAGGDGRADINTDSCSAKTNNAAAGLICFVHLYIGSDTTYRDLTSLNITFQLPGAGTRITVYKSLVQPPAEQRSVSINSAIILEHNTLP
jgi:hypothetical protein